MRAKKILFPALLFIPISFSVPLILSSCNKSNQILPLDDRPIDNPFNKNTYDTSQTELVYDSSQQVYNIKKIKKPTLDFDLLPDYDDGVNQKHPVRISHDVLKTLKCKNLFIYDNGSITTAPTYQSGLFSNLNVSYIYVHNLDNFNNDAISFDANHHVGLFIYKCTSFVRPSKNLGMFEGYQSGTMYGIEFIHFFKDCTAKILPTHTFKGCDRLTSLILPDSVEKMEKEAIIAENIQAKKDIPLSFFSFPKNLKEVYKYDSSFYINSTKPKKSTISISSSCSEPHLKAFVDAKKVNPNASLDLSFEDIF
jgi:hypothetical protein